MTIMDREGIGTLWKGLYIAVFHIFVFNASVAKPSLALFSGLALFRTIRFGVSTLKNLYQQ